MKPFLSLVLVVSLAGNVWLLTRWRANSAASSGNPSANSSSAVSASAKNNSASAKKTSATSRPATIAWSEPGDTVAELRTWAAQLRAAGFPPRVVNSLLSDRLRDRNHKLAELPFWQLMNPGQASRELRTADVKEQQTLREEIMGTEGTPAALFPPGVRERRYGDLSDDQVNAIVRIDAEYSDLSAGINSSSGGIVSSADMRERNAQRQLLQKEKLADLAAVMSPAELQAYEMRTSDTARRVQSNLRTLDVSEEEYATIYAAQKSFAEKTGAVTSTFSATSAEERASYQASQYAMQDQLRAALPEDKFFKYLTTSDFAYGQIALFAEKQPSITPAVSYQLYQLRNDAANLQQDLSLRQRTAVGDRAAQTKLNDERNAAQAALNARLDALLPAAVAEEFRASESGRMYFRKPTPPRPPQPPKS
ncbi:hypothetical protein [Oleiharenicola lentus]|uniref:hypothetical protein n=1 Tax=Oleiharenicola lentus TaxID=2508720 RepID=UPI003F66DF3B